MEANKKLKLKATLEPNEVCAIIDTREQHPLDLSPLKTEVSVLETGDYSLASCKDLVRIERKSLPDLLACVGGERERFEREVQRLLAFPVRVLVIESDWQEIEMGKWIRPKITTEQVVGSLLGWQAMGLSIHMCSDHARASRHVARLLFTIARRRYRELRRMVLS